MSIIPITIFSSAIIFLFLIGEYFVLKGKVSEVSASWILKLIISSILAFAPMWTSNKYELILICGLSIAAIFLMYQLFMFRSASIIRSKFRQLLLMFTSYILLVILFLEHNPRIITLSILILGVADTLADIISYRIGKWNFQLTSDKKSIPGTIFFALITIPILLLTDEIVNSVFPETNWPVNLDQFHVILAFSIVIIVTSFKAIASIVWENFYIPVSAAVLLYIFFESPSMELLVQFNTGILVAGFIAAVSYKFKFLTASGSVATFLLASFIFGLGALQWSIPIMTFFILSSLLSKIRKKSNNSVEDYFEKTGVRDHLQVLANGGLGGILVIFYHFTSYDIFFIMYLASLSAVCADTWATEIGTMWKTKTYNILNLKPIEQGVSGGISVIGTSGALLGSIIIAVSGCYWFNENFLLYSLIVIIAGIFGSFLDSFMGATIQIQFECINCSKITEKSKHCGQTTKSVRGISWINNDMVNIMAAAAGVLVTYFIWIIRN